MYQQLADELASAKAQIVRISTEQDQLKAAAQAAIAASEARTKDMIAQINQAGGKQEDSFNIVDFRDTTPGNFHGRRNESWKLW